LFYGRFERLEPQIHAELAERRAERASAHCEGDGGRSKI
jgi:hypothetical protein